MRSLVNVLGGLRIQFLNPLMAMVLSLGIVVGISGQADAQTSRYTLDDVMGKLIEMDKRLSVVESQIKNLGDRIDDTNARIDDTNTTMRWLFGFLGTLFLGILALTFATYKNTASLVKPTDRRALKEAKALEALGEEVKALAERQTELERKLTTAKII